jgi:hypothetical protein
MKMCFHKGIGRNFLNFILEKIENVGRVGLILYQTSNIKDNKVPK